MSVLVAGGAMAVVASATGAAATLQLGGVAGVRWRFVAAVGKMVWLPARSNDRLVGLVVKYDGGRAGRSCGGAAVREAAAVAVGLVVGDRWRSMAAVRK